MKSTATTPTRTTPPEIQALAKRLHEWRARRGRGQRIPESIWKEASRLARIHGLNPTAAPLRLNYYDLQRRAGDVAPSRKVKEAAGARFVELVAAGGEPTAPEAGTVEVVRPSGARLVVRLPLASAGQLLPLFQAFLRS